MSEGLAAGEVLDVLALADEDRPEISVLSEEFLESIAAKTERPNIQIRLLERLLKGEIRARAHANQPQAKLFGERIETVLRRYEARQISAAEVIELMVEMARNMRGARRRHEELGLSVEEAAFYDALAGGAAEGKADPALVKIAAELVEGIRADLAVDWADRESSEAAVRRRIKRLLRKHNYRPSAAAAAGGGEGPYDVNRCTQLVLEQAKALYRYWPDVEYRLFA